MWVAIERNWTQLNAHSHGGYLLELTGKQSYKHWSPNHCQLYTWSVLAWTSKESTSSGASGMQYQKLRKSQKHLVKQCETYWNMLQNMFIQVPSSSCLLIWPNCTDILCLHRSDVCIILISLRLCFQGVWSTKWLIQPISWECSGALRSWKYRLPVPFRPIQSRRGQRSIRRWKANVVWKKRSPT